MTSHTRILASASVAALVALAAPAAVAEEIEIAIGHQSMCTDTYTAGIVVKELGLLEKHLPTTGKYEGIEYDVSWADYSSGGPITNQMLAGKLNFGVM
ncbi:MAG: sulfonate ABC transporter substrate-binding protein, partial [Pseudomonadota bacterium]